MKPKKRLVRADWSEEGYVEWKYDERGNRIKETYCGRDGSIVAEASFFYDENNRLSEVNYSDKILDKYEYDEYDRVSIITSTDIIDNKEIKKITNTYDEHGNCRLKEERSLNDLPFRDERPWYPKYFTTCTEYKYDKYNRVIKEYKYIPGYSSCIGEIDYKYSDNGLLTEVRYFTGYVEKYEYDDDGYMISADLGYDTYIRYEYETIE